MCRTQRWRKRTFSCPISHQQLQAGPPALPALRQLCPQPNICTEAAQHCHSSGQGCLLHLPGTHLQTQQGQAESTAAESIVDISCSQALPPAAAAGIPAGDVQTEEPQTERKFWNYCLAAHWEKWEYFTGQLCSRICPIFPLPQLSARFKLSD